MLGVTAPLPGFRLARHRERQLAPFPQSVAWVNMSRSSRGHTGVTSRSSILKGSTAFLNRLCAVRLL